ncbi:MAG: ATP-grasp domain-containing protein [Candidatus Roizmanbacteria bacterium]
MTDENYFLNNSLEQKFSKKKNILKNRKLLVVNTGSIKKKFVFQRLKQLGLHIIVLNREKNWAEPYVNEWILYDNPSHTEAIAAVEKYMTTHGRKGIEGIVTFWEDDVLLTSKLVDKLNLIGIPYQTGKRVRNKFLFREFCEQNGIPSPKHKLIRKESDIKKLKDEFVFPIVMKPVYGSSSAYVVKIHTIEELLDTFSYLRKNMAISTESALTDGLEVFVEEYIDGDEVDIDILLQNGKIKFYSISDNDLTIEPFFVETGQSIPSSLPKIDQDALIKQAEESLEKLGVQHGVIHFEAKSTRNGPVPIEINLRMGGDEVYSFVKGAWGTDLIESAVKIALGIYIPVSKLPVNPKKCLTGKYFLTTNSGILATCEVDKQIRKEPYLEELHLLKQIGDPILVPPEGYEYLGWVTVSGDNLNDAKDNLNDASKYISYNVVKFDTDSALGKTSRKNKFSSAVMNKNLLLKTAKIEHMRRLSSTNLHNLHIGVLESNSIYVNAENSLETTGKSIAKALIKRGYKATYVNQSNPFDSINELRNSNVDLVFNVCIDGNGPPYLQPNSSAMLDMLEIPYTGSDARASLLCKDKINVKKLLTYHNIPTPKWDYVYTMDDEMEAELKYPLIVKPANTDNSYGISNKSVVKNKKELQNQLQYVIEQLHHPALIEEFIEGDEYDVSIIGTDENDYQVMPLYRTIFKNLDSNYWPLYTYDAKLGTDSAYDKLIIQHPPKQLSRRLEALITEISLDTYAILDCFDYGLVEIRIDKDNNPYVLELNPNPSLEIGSVLVDSAKLLRMNYGDLLESIIISTIKRYKQSSSSFTTIPTTTISYGV